MKNNKRPNIRRRSIRRRTIGGSSEGYGRKASTSCSVGVSVTGNQGITFSPEILLRKYFQDPRLIRITGYRIRINVLDIQQPYLQYQALCMADNIGGPLVCMTQPKTITMQRSTQNVRIARDRSFWIESTDDTHNVLDIKFLAFQTSKLIIEVTTFFNIEQDEVTAVSAIKEIQPYNIGEEFETISNASVVQQMREATITVPKRLTSVARK